MEEWINAASPNRRRFEELQAAWQASLQLAPASRIDVDQQWQRFQEKIVAGKKKRPGFTWWRVAASIILVFGLSWLALDRFAGKPAAQMALESGAAVLADTLPDGSIVTLNQHSTLSYPEQFKGASRPVTLQGEAFFRVAPDKKKPFEIKVNNVLVTVVGTSFNIRARNGITEVIVETGVVRVSRGNSVLELHPGEKTIVQNDSAFTRQPVRDHLYNYYQTREFVCDDIPLWRLVDVVNEAYGSQLECGNEKVRNLHYNGTFPNESLERIVEVLQLTFKLTVRREGNKIILQ